MPSLLRKALWRLNALCGIGVESTLMYELAAGETIPQQALAEGATIVRLSPKDEGLLRAAPDATAELSRSRFQDGDACYVVLLDGKLAHHSWVKRNGVQVMDEAGRKYPVEAGEFWIYHCWTAEW